MIINSIQEIPEFLRKKKIGFTNGCFDIIHSGHITVLKQAKNFCDILVVGLNSDESVKRLKGNKRPINSQEDRAFILNSIKFVDFVIIFEEDTPERLIIELTPQVLIKGGDWKEENIVGGIYVKQKGGRVLSLPYQKGFSTTDIISKIQKIK